MMKSNPIQFAVVREDPMIEAEVIRTSGAESVFLIGSGGCTALTLQALFPGASFTIVDPNPAQIVLVKQKMKQLTNSSPNTRNQIFNIGHDNPEGLNACGNFESLFRCFRKFLNEFVVSDREMHELLGSSSSGEAFKQIFDGRYWSVAFDIHFTNSFLEAMFGHAAVQHAPPGSYSTYFRKAFEVGLLAPGIETNYFLHHVLLGCYRDVPEALPNYLVSKVPKFRFSFIESSAEHVRGWNAFDMVDLSNIFDWMPELSVKELARQLSCEMRSGSQLIFRQLNHTKDFTRFFNESFRFDPILGEDLLTKDRSLFYSKINIATKT